MAQYLLKPAGVLIGFATEDDWFDYKLEHDPRFLKRVAESRASYKAGKGVSWEEVDRKANKRK